MYFTQYLGSHFVLIYLEVGIESADDEADILVIIAVKNNYKI
ncbi:hypothetical protein FM120_31040 [Sphingobacterium faecium PCAi_F2.5]|nr:hypothetical protein BN1088_1430762 [Sphingobacterium sp. PM2-P1-29]SJN51519.1 hypothetical protein FM120_31040 [Sphingobacterium faecium PCAi_F2.5]